MFFSIQLLGQKTPLGKLWMAAHQDRRLKRQDITETSIAKSVEQILHSDTPLALRLSGTLLLGVVKIFTRQLSYLSSDCSDTLNKLNQAQKTVGVRSTDAAAGGARGTVVDAATITLPDDSEFMRIQLAGDLDAFNLFEDDNASSSLAMAVEAHDSFMLIDDISGLLGSQISGEEEHFMVSVDGEEYPEPELLRAELSAERSYGDARNALGAALGSPDAGAPGKYAGAKSPSTVSRDAAASEHSAGDGSVAHHDDRGLEEHDFPALPEIDMFPAEPMLDEPEAEAPAEELPQPQPASPGADGGAAATPAGGPDPDVTAQDASTSGAPPPDRPTPDEPEYDPTPEPPPAVPAKRARRGGKAAGAGRTRTGTLRANKSKETTLPRDETRSLLQDRSPLLRPLPPLVSAFGVFARAGPAPVDAAADDDAVLAFIKPTQYLNRRTLDDAARVLLDASCGVGVIPLAAWRGETGPPGEEAAERPAKRGRADDEIEDDAVDRASPGSGTPAQTPASIEQLRHDGALSSGRRRGKLDLAVPAVPGGSAARSEGDRMEEFGMDEAPMPQEDERLDEALHDDGIPPPDFGDMGMGGFEDEMSPHHENVDGRGDLQPSGGLGEQTPKAAHKRGALLREEDSEDEQGEEEQQGDKSATPATVSFTTHTKKTLRCLQALVKENAGKKRKTGDHGRVSLDTIDLEHFTQGASRMEAARYFYDVLVLQGKGFIELRQDKPFDTMHITPANLMDD